MSFRAINFSRSQIKIRKEKNFPFFGIFLRFFMLNLSESSPQAHKHSHTHKNNFLECTFYWFWDLISKEEILLRHENDLKFCGWLRNDSRKHWLNIFTNFFKVLSKISLELKLNHTLLPQIKKRKKKRRKLLQFSGGRGR